MSKVLILFVIIFLTLFNPFIPEALAAASCSSQAITYDPKFFPENSGDLTLNFIINDTNTFNTLKDKPVRLHFSVFPGGPFGDRNTNETTVTSKNFSLTITASELKGKGKYEGVLDWKSGSDFTEFCSQIKYEVGISRCNIIGLSNQMPPGSQPTISFTGQADTEYALRTELHLALGARKETRVGQVTTNDKGGGQFNDVAIPGSVGDTVTVKILQTGLVGTADSCSQDIKISATAPPPPTPSPGPVIPVGPSVPKPTIIPTTSGDPDTQCGSPVEPGIRTAIGCIHTSPVGFIKDSLKFIIGISGGLAFLMMLLGAFQMLTSAGNPETLAAGKDRLTSAIIGLLFVIFAVLLMQIIGVDILNIPGFKP